MNFRLIVALCYQKQKLYKMSKLIQLLLLISLFNFHTIAQNADASKRVKHFNLENGVAIQGYDPVAYFIQHKAVKGKKELAVNADGVIYYCSSAENKELLQKNYKAYEPAYGGWCAYAMGNSGEKVNIDPSTFKISNNRLYLFYNAYFNNTLKSWNKDENQLTKKADANWKKIY